MNRMRPTSMGVQVSRPLERVEMDECKIDLMTLLAKSGLLAMFAPEDRERLGLDDKKRRCWLRKPCGTTYVTEHFVENSKGKRIRLFALDDLLQFRKEHISLTEIAETENFSTKVMKMKMDGRGAEPIAPKYELGRIWYRRECHALH